MKRIVEHIVRNLSLVALMLALAAGGSAWGQPQNNPVNPNWNGGANQRNQIWGGGNPARRIEFANLGARINAPYVVSTRPSGEVGPSDGHKKRETHVAPWGKDADGGQQFVVVGKWVNSSGAELALSATKNLSLEEGAPVAVNAYVAMMGQDGHPIAVASTQGVHVKNVNVAVAGEENDRRIYILLQYNLAKNSGRFQFVAENSDTSTVEFFKNQDTRNHPLTEINKTENLRSVTQPRLVVLTLDEGLKVEKVFEPIYMSVDDTHTLFDVKDFFVQKDYSNRERITLSGTVKRLLYKAFTYRGENGVLQKANNSYDDLLDELSGNDEAFIFAQWVDVKNNNGQYEKLFRGEKYVSTTRHGFTSENVAWYNLLMGKTKAYRTVGKNEVLISDLDIQNLNSVSVPTFSYVHKLYEQSEGGAEPVLYVAGITVTKNIDFIFYDGSGWCDKGEGGYDFWSGGTEYTNSIYGRSAFIERINVKQKSHEVIGSVQIPERRKRFISGLGVVNNVATLVVSYENDLELQACTNPTGGGYSGFFPSNLCTRWSAKNGYYGSFHDYTWPWKSKQKTGQHLLMGINLKQKERDLDRGEVHYLGAYFVHLLDGPEDNGYQCPTAVSEDGKVMAFFPSVGQFGQKSDVSKFGNRTNDQLTCIAGVPFSEPRYTGKFHEPWSDPDKARERYSAQNVGGSHDNIFLTLDFEGMGLMGPKKESGSNAINLAGAVRYRDNKASVVNITKQVDIWDTDYIGKNVPKNPYTQVFTAEGAEGVFKYGDRFTLEFSGVPEGKVIDWTDFKYEGCKPVDGYSGLFEVTGAPLRYVVRPGNKLFNYGASSMCDLYGVRVSWLPGRTKVIGATKTIQFITKGNSTNCLDGLYLHVAGNSDSMQASSLSSPERRLNKGTIFWITGSPEPIKIEKATKLVQEGKIVWRCDGDVVVHVDCDHLWYEWEWPVVEGKPVTQVRITRDGYATPFSSFAHTRSGDFHFLRDGDIFEVLPDAAMLQGKEIEWRLKQGFVEKPGEENTFEVPADLPVSTVFRLEGNLVNKPVTLSYVITAGEGEVSGTYREGNDTKEINFSGTSATLPYGVDFTLSFDLSASVTAFVAGGDLKEEKDVRIFSWKMDGDVEVYIDFQNTNTIPTLNSISIHEIQELEINKSVDLKVDVDPSSLQAKDLNLEWSWEPVDNNQVTPGKVAIEAGPKVNGVKEGWVWIKARKRWGSRVVADSILVCVVSSGHSALRSLGVQDTITVYYSDFRSVKYYPDPKDGLRPTDRFVGTQAVEVGGRWIPGRELNLPNDGLEVRASDGAIKGKKSANLPYDVFIHLKGHPNLGGHIVVYVKEGGSPDELKDFSFLGGEVEKKKVLKNVLSTVPKNYYKKGSFKFVYAPRLGNFEYDGGDKNYKFTAGADTGLVEVKVEHIGSTLTAPGRIQIVDGNPLPLKSLLFNPPKMNLASGNSFTPTYTRFPVDDNTEITGFVLDQAQKFAGILKLEDTLIKGKKFPKITAEPGIEQGVEYSLFIYIKTKDGSAEKEHPSVGGHVTIIGVVDQNLDCNKVLEFIKPQSGVLELDKGTHVVAYGLDDSTITLTKGLTRRGTDYRLSIEDESIATIGNQWSYSDNFSVTGVDTGATRLYAEDLRGCGQWDSLRIVVGLPGTFTSPLKGISVKPDTLTLCPGSNHQLSVYPRVDDPDKMDEAWEDLKEYSLMAKDTGQNSNLKFTIPNGAFEFTLHVPPTTQVTNPPTTQEATFYLRKGGHDYPHLSDIINVTIKECSVGSELEKIIVSPLEVTVGGSKELVVRTVPADWNGTLQYFTHSDKFTVDKNGKVSGESVGSDTVYVQSKEPQGGVTVVGKAVVTVIAQGSTPTEITSITAAPIRVNEKDVKSGSLTRTIHYTPSPYSTETVEELAGWDKISLDFTGLSGFSSDDGRELTIGTNVQVGTYEIPVTLTSPNGTPFHTTLTVEVVADKPNVPKLKSLQIVVGEVEVGKQEDVEIRTDPVGYPREYLKWEMANTGIATVDATTPADVKVKGVAEGSTLLWASDANGNLPDPASAVVKVVAQGTNPELRGIFVNPTEFWLAKGNSTPLTIAPVPNTAPLDGKTFQVVDFTGSEANGVKVEGATELKLENSSTLEVDTHKLRIQLSDDPSIGQDIVLHVVSDPGSGKLISFNLPGGEVTVDASDLTLTPWGFVPSSYDKKNLEWTTESSPISSKGGAAVEANGEGDGEVTGLEEGWVRVCAMDRLGSGVRRWADVEVKAKGTPLLQIDSMVVIPTSLTVDKAVIPDKHNLPLSVTVYKGGVPVTGYTFDVRDFNATTAPEGIGAIPTGGLTLTKEKLQVQDYELFIFIEDHPAVGAPFTLTVKETTNPQPSSALNHISVGDVSVVVGETVEIPVNLDPANYSWDNLEWKSQNPAIFTLEDEKFKVKGVEAGEAKVVVWDVATTGLVAEGTVKVLANGSTGAYTGSLTAMPFEARLRKGATLQLNYTLEVTPKLNESWDYFLKDDCNGEFTINSSNGHITLKEDAKATAGDVLRPKVGIRLKGGKALDLAAIITITVDGRNAGQCTKDSLELTGLDLASQVAVKGQITGTVEGSGTMYALQNLLSTSSSHVSTELKEESGTISLTVNGLKEGLGSVTVFDNLGCGQSVYKQVQVVAQGNNASTLKGMSFKKDFYLAKSGNTTTDSCEVDWKDKAPSSPEFELSSEYFSAGYTNGKIVLSIVGAQKDKVQVGTYTRVRVWLKDNLAISQEVTIHVLDKFSECYTSIDIEDFYLVGENSSQTNPYYTEPVGVKGSLKKEDLLAKGYEQALSASIEDLDSVKVSLKSWPQGQSSLLMDVLTLKQTGNCKDKDSAQALVWVYEKAPTEKKPFFTMERKVYIAMNGSYRPNYQPVPPTQSNNSSGKLPDEYVGYGFDMDMKVIRSEALTQDSNVYVKHDGTIVAGESAGIYVIYVQAEGQTQEVGRLVTVHVVDGTTPTDKWLTGPSVVEVKVGDNYPVTAEWVPEAPNEFELSFVSANTGVFGVQKTGALTASVGGRAEGDSWLTIQDTKSGASWNRTQVLVHTPSNPLPKPSGVDSMAILPDTFTVYKKTPSTGTFKPLYLFYNAKQRAYPAYSFKCDSTDFKQLKLKSFGSDGEVELSVSNGNIEAEAGTYSLRVWPVDTSKKEEYKTLGRDIVVVVKGGVYPGASLVPEVDSMFIADGEVEVNGTANVRVELYDKDGKRILLTKAIMPHLHFESTDPSVLTLKVESDSILRMTGVSEGVSTIYGMSKVKPSVNAQAQVQVYASGGGVTPVNHSILVKPSPITIARGKSNRPTYTYDDGSRIDPQTFHRISLEAPYVDLGQEWLEKDGKGLLRLLEDGTIEVGEEASADTVTLRVCWYDGEDARLYVNGLVTVIIREDGRNPNPPAPGPDTLISIALTTVDVKVGDTVPVGHVTNPENWKLDWGVEPYVANNSPDSAGRASIDAEGKLTGIGVGYVLVKAYDHFGGSISESVVCKVYDDNSTPPLLGDIDSFTVTNPIVVYEGQIGTEGLTLDSNTTPSFKYTFYKEGEEVQITRHPGAVLHPAVDEVSIVDSTKLQLAKGIGVGEYPLTIHLCGRFNFMAQTVLIVEDVQRPGRNDSLTFLQITGGELKFELGKALRLGRSTNPPNYEHLIYTLEGQHSEHLSVDQDGVVRVISAAKDWPARSETSFSVTVTARDRFNQEMFDTARVVVYKEGYNPYNPVPRLISITLRGGRVQVDETVDVAYETVPRDWKGELEWETSDQSIAHVENGQLTGVKEGWVTVKAEEKNGLVSGQVEFEVVAQGTPSQNKIATLEAHGLLTVSVDQLEEDDVTFTAPALTYTARRKDGTIVPSGEYELAYFDYSTRKQTERKPISFVEVKDNGDVTVSMGVAEGTHTLFVHVRGDEGVGDTLQLRVLKKGSLPATPLKELSLSSTTIRLGEELSLDTLTNTTPQGYKEVDYLLVNEDYGVAAVSADGRFTTSGAFPLGVSQSRAVVRVVDRFSQLAADAFVTILDSSGTGSGTGPSPVPSPVGIYIQPESICIAKGGSHPLLITPEPANFSLTNITFVVDEDNKGIFSMQGMTLRAADSAYEKDYTVTISVEGNPLVSRTIAVKVVDQATTATPKIELQPLTLVMGEDAQRIEMLKDGDTVQDDKDYKKYLWSSSDYDIARVVDTIKYEPVSVGVANALLNEKPGNTCTGVTAMTSVSVIDKANLPTPIARDEIYHLRALPGQHVLAREVVEDTAVTLMTTYSPLGKDFELLPRARLSGYGYGYYYGSYPSTLKGVSIDPESGSFVVAQGQAPAEGVYVLTVFLIDRSTGAEYPQVNGQVELKMTDTVVVPSGTDPLIKFVLFALYEMKPNATVSHPVREIDPRDYDKLVWTIEDITIVEFMGYDASTQKFTLKSAEDSKDKTTQVIASDTTGTGITRIATVRVTDNPSKNIVGLKVAPNPLQILKKGARTLFFMDQDGAPLDKEEKFLIDPTSNVVADSLFGYDDGSRELRAIKADTGTTYTVRFLYAPNHDVYCDLVVEVVDSSSVPPAVRDLKELAIGGLPLLKVGDTDTVRILSQYPITPEVKGGMLDWVIRNLDGTPELKDSAVDAGLQVESVKEKGLVEVIAQSINGVNARTRVKIENNPNPLKVGDTTIMGLKAEPQEFTLFHGAKLPILYTLLSEPAGLSIEEAGVSFALEDADDYTGKVELDPEKGVVTGYVTSGDSSTYLVYVYLKDKSGNAYKSLGVYLTVHVTRTNGNAYGCEIIGPDTIERYDDPSRYYLKNAAPGTIVSWRSSSVDSGEVYISQDGYAYGLKEGLVQIEAYDQMGFSANSKEVLVIRKPRALEISVLAGTGEILVTRGKDTLGVTTRKEIDDGKKCNPDSVLYLKDIFKVKVNPDSASVVVMGADRIDDSTYMVRDDVSIFVDYTGTTIFPLLITKEGVGNPRVEVERNGTPTSYTKHGAVYLGERMDVYFKEIRGDSAQFISLNVDGADLAKDGHTHYMSRYIVGNGGKAPSDSMVHVHGVYGSGEVRMYSLQIFPGNSMVDVSVLYLIDPATNKPVKKVMRREDFSGRSLKLRAIKESEYYDRILPEGCYVLLSVIPNIGYRHEKVHLHSKNYLDSPDSIQPGRIGVLDYLIPLVKRDVMVSVECAVHKGYYEVSVDGVPVDMPVIRMNPVVDLLEVINAQEVVSYTIITVSGTSVQSGRHDGAPSLVQKVNMLPGVYVIRLDMRDGTTVSLPFVKQ